MKKIQYPSGSTYVGEIKNSHTRDGKGMMYYANGDKYKGLWKDDKRDGKGKYILKNGNIFRGIWKEDKKDGKGVFKNNKGTKFNVYYINGRREDDICCSFLKKVEKSGSSYFQGDWLSVAYISTISKLGTDKWWFKIEPTSYAWDKEVESDKWRKLLFQSIWICENQENDLEKYHLSNAGEKTDNLSDYIIILEPLKWVEDPNNNLKKEIWVQLNFTFPESTDNVPSVSHFLNKNIYLDANQKNIFIPKNSSPSDSPSSESISTFLNDKKNIIVDSENISKFTPQENANDKITINYSNQTKEFDLETANWIFSILNENEDIKMMANGEPLTNIHHPKDKIILELKKN